MWTSLDNQTPLDGSYALPLLMNGATNEMKSSSIVSNIARMPIYDLLAAKYDGTVYRVFTNNVLLDDGPERAIFYSECGSEFLNTGTQTRCSSECDEFVVMMKKEHYNMVILLKESGLVEYYINLTLIPDPASGNAIKYIDMDIDLLFTNKNRIVELLDDDEFEHNSLIYKYSETDKQAIHLTVQKLKNMVATGHYYLSEAFVEYCKDLLRNTS